MFIPSNGVLCIGLEPYALYALSYFAILPVYAFYISMLAVPVILIPLQLVCCSWSLSQQTTMVVLASSVHTCRQQPSSASTFDNVRTVIFIRQRCHLALNTMCLHLITAFSMHKRYRRRRCCMDNNAYQCLCSYVHKHSTRQFICNYKRVSFQRLRFSFCCSNSAVRLL